MKLYLVKTPKIIKRFYPKRVWAFPKDTNAVFLSFDDGPIPEVTPWVLEQLKKHQAKATFFCIGENIKKHPGIFKRILSEGHSVGNHTYNHLNGWNTKTEDYIKNCEIVEEIIDDIEAFGQGYKKSTNNSALSTQHSTLFRPPFGKLTSKQSKALQKKGYKIIMWDLLSADFDSSISKEKCLKNVLKNIQKGSIIVFHDSLKAEEKLRYALPKVLEFLKESEIDCKRIL